MAGEAARPLHVLVLPSFYQTPERPYNGTFFRDWALAMQRAGVRVGVAFVEDRSLRSLSVSALRESHFQMASADEGGLPTVRLKAWNPLAQWTPGGRIWAGLMQRAIRHYEHLHGKPDLVAAYSAMWAGEAARLAKPRGRPYVITEVNTAFGTATVHGAARTVSKRAFDEAEAVIAISRNLQERLVRFTGRDAVALIPCAVDEAFWTLPRGDRSRSPFTFYAQAHLTARKGFDLLIRAFAAGFKGDRSVQLVIGGDGAERDNLRRLATTCEVTGQVSFLGALPREGVRQAMWAADAFVLPSLAENFGVVLIEAMATGLPVISTRCGGPEDILTPEVGVLCEPGDVEGLTRALAELRRMPTPAPARIRESALTRFSYATVGRQLRDFYVEVLSR